MGARMNERCTTRMELMSRINIEPNSAPERERRPRAIYLSFILSVFYLFLSHSFASFLCVRPLSTPAVVPAACSVISPRYSYSLVLPGVFHACAIQRIERPHSYVRTYTAERRQKLRIVHILAKEDINLRCAIYRAHYEFL